MALRARSCARSSAPSCPTAKASSPPTTAGTWPPTANACAPLIAEAQALGVRVSLFMDPLPEAMALARARRRRPRRALHRALCRAPTARRGRPSELARFAAAAAAALARGPGRQRRPRPEPRQPRRLPARRARRAGGVDRPCADRRRAGARPGRDGARLPALHPRGRRPRGRGMIYGIGTDICDIRRIAGHAGAPRRPLRRDGAGRCTNCRSSARAARASRRAACATWPRASRPRRPSPRPSAWACACR